MKSLTITTSVIKVNKYALFILLYIGIGVMSTAAIAIFSHSEIIIWIGMFLFIVAPGIFSTFFRKKYTQEVEVKFTDDSISISNFEMNTI